MLCYSLTHVWSVRTKTRANTIDLKTREAPNGSRLELCHQATSGRGTSWVCRRTS
ncbi:hypothetical protein RchiOBHm_Chr3g0465561 [Rosa chinensis]|uniref:Uncharacterized protein n=1 Tax=Rosa chinensis TaxID=74649 RepID=A0A2P6R9R6_ROSCH|nr:hypothetical protein RchiOBHm_Chr3g0465561 [Rosa chinensis]